MGYTAKYKMKRIFEVQESSTIKETENVIRGLTREMMFSRRIQITMKKQ